MAANAPVGRGGRTTVVDNLFQLEPINQNRAKHPLETSDNLGPPARARIWRSEPEVETNPPIRSRSASTRSRGIRGCSKPDDRDARNNEHQNGQKQRGKSAVQNHLSSWRGQPGQADNQAHHFQRGNQDRNGEDYDNRTRNDGRGNQDRNGEAYDNRRRNDGRGNQDRNGEGHDNRRRNDGRGNQDRNGEAYDNRRRNDGRGNRDGNGEDYDNRRRNDGRGNQDRNGEGYDNRRRNDGRGNQDRNGEDYDNQRRDDGRGNQDRNGEGHDNRRRNDGRGNQDRNGEDYDNQRRDDGRGNQDRNGEGHDNRRSNDGRGNQDRNGEDYDNRRRDDAQNIRQVRDNDKRRGNHEYRTRGEGGRNDKDDHHIPRRDNNAGDRMNDRPNNYPHNRPRVPSYSRLENLSKQDPNEVLTVLANTQNGFLTLIADDLRPDLMILIMKVLAISCDSDFKQNKGKLLFSVCNNSSKFLDKLSMHLNGISVEKSRQRREGLKMFFEDCLSVFATIIDLLPTTARECLAVPLVSIDVAITNATEFFEMTFDSKTLARPKVLKSQLKVLIATEETEVKVSRRMEFLAHESPPDDFRDLSIFPTPTDILNHDQAFVRPNIIQGAYENVDHYLDVQFRLLREDFVQPLREGITNYIASVRDGTKKKLNNIRVYTNTKFEKVNVVKDCMGYEVKFENKRKIKWEYSKGFMFGSLLCFTNNNFRSILFATVLDRDVKKLEHGTLSVKLESGMEPGDDIFLTPFIMVESEVYFEPYYHVLKALQSMKPKMFPMSQYIVSVQAHSNPPQYVLHHPYYRYQIGDYKVQLLEEQSWPSAAQLGLDESQYEAYKSALTKEFVVIQGPPGTGKTYLALKLAKTILINMRKLLDSAAAELYRFWGMEHLDYWPEEDDSDDEVVNSDHTPILVVCFTNHALDQFLEGLLTQTKNLIRVGGQSKSETLQEYNLKEKRRMHKRTDAAFQLSRDIRSRMSDLMCKIKGIQLDMEQLDSRSGIVAVESIASVYKHANLNCFMGNDGKLSNQMLLEWLHYPYDMGEEESHPHQLPSTSQEEEEVQGKHDEDLDDNKGEEIWQRAPVEEFDLDENSVTQVKIRFALMFKEQEERLKQLCQKIEIAKTKDIGTYVLHDIVWELESEYQGIANQLENLTFGMKSAKPIDRVFWQQLLDERVNLWELDYEQRWSFYRQCIALLHISLEQELHAIELLYRDEAKQFEEVKQMEDLQVMRTADVVGMTTTGAARLQPMLQALRCRIVIVEEAAEVMESHIIVSLTSHCQHLILIGDHKQLRPTTAVYKLARDFNFDISLFERMLKNGLHCEQLNVQHRMQPDIAKLIVPSIYAKLNNHPSVLEYKKINGVTKSLFFLNHKNAELAISDTNSKSNPFEADTLLALCRYLLLQGYAADKITILTTYAGQMFYLRKERRRFPSLANVQMTIVDNFQGEENDIIILSLVRNNQENNIGFLKTENRVCVALSRARHGMFIMGNMDNLTHPSNIRYCQVWPMIKEALMKQEALGERLVLRCQIHPHQFTYVTCADDFNQVPEGGCRLPCDADLDCGHRCKSMCHASDRDHIEYMCYEKCTRIPLDCDREHPCPKLCSVVCGDCVVPVRYHLRCGHSIALPCHVDAKTYKCVELVEVFRDACGHTFDKPCHLDMGTYQCPLPCENRLDCGHSCKLKCHVDEDPDHIQYKCKMPCPKKNAGCKLDHSCSRKCYEECKDCVVEVRMKPANCDHMLVVPCHTDPATIVCTKPCKRTIQPCGHKCKKKCNMPCTDCSEKVSKIVPECGHRVQLKCCETPVIGHCSGPCTKYLSCGHKCMRSCKMGCSSPMVCIALVQSRAVPACGHTGLQLPCNIESKGLDSGSQIILSYCQEKCNDLLKCDHKCSGTCGSCQQGRIHEKCKEKCGRILVCGHECIYPCAETCPPCKLKCRFNCKHSKCNRLCGVPCVSCKEKCKWRCDHMVCTMLCGQKCNRQPCYEPCKKYLPCKHPCIGFCGEPCPPLCRICNEEEVTTPFFGDEDEPGARFVYLEDCKHTVLSDGIEQWLNMEQEEILIPRCPICKTDIMKTLRFMNQIKTSLKDVCAVKKKVFGDKKTIDDRRTALLTKLLHGSQADHMMVAAKALRDKLEAKLQPIITATNKRNFLSMIDLETIDSQIAILFEVQEVFSKTKLKVSGDSLATFIQHLNWLLCAIKERDLMSTQEVGDFNGELKRIQRIAHYFELKTKMMLTAQNPKVLKMYESAHRIVMSKRRYTDEDDTNLARYIRDWALVLQVELTAKERKEIVAAMNMGQGHWFKCPNGHPYVIGECGGAMVESRCADCNEKIGGSSHRLLTNNAVATEMDGARMGAYERAAAGFQYFLAHDH